MRNRRRPRATIRGAGVWSSPDELVRPACAVSSSERGPRDRARTPKMGDRAVIDERCLAERSRDVPVRWPRAWLRASGANRHDDGRSRRDGLICFDAP
jgi:hypothetical protein